MFLNAKPWLRVARPIRKLAETSLFKICENEVRFRTGLELIEYAPGSAFA